MGGIRPEIRYSYGNVPCRLVDVGNGNDWQKEHSRGFDVAVDNELREFQPQITVVQGFSPADRKSHERLRAKGSKLVLAFSSFPPEGFAEGAESIYHATLCHSQWLASQVTGSTLLPPPVPARDVIPESPEPVCVTLIHPSRDNGLFLLLRLAEQLSLNRPEDPILALSSAGAETTGGDLLKLGRASGFDLGQYKNILIADAAASPSDVWGPTQVFVAPTLANPPVSMIAEALVNGIPPVVGDRIAIPEILNGAGFSLPLPLDYALDTRAPIPAVAVEAWADLIGRLTSDDTFYAAESEKAREAGRGFDPAVLAPRYVEFFASVLSGGSSA